MSLNEEKFNLDLNEDIKADNKTDMNLDVIYQKNLKALEQHHPHLIELIENTEDEGKTRVELSKSGDPRIIYKKDDGEEVYIHSYVDPINCANWAIDLLGQMEKEGIAVLFGFGLGYFAEEIFKRFEQGHALMVYEATTDLFKAALRTRDLSELFESERVHVVLGEDADNFQFLSVNRYQIANGKFWVVKHHPSTSLNEEAYERFYKRLDEEKLFVEMNTNTGVNMGKEFIHSFIKNIPALIRKQGVVKLRGAFKGSPAVIVSAGPSLDRNLHLLNKVKGKAVIIAVDAALPTLLPCNIIPDVVVAIDPLQKVASMYKDNPLLRQVPLICLSQYQTDVLQKYPGPVFISGMPQSIVHQWFAGFWEDKGFLECAGGSVAHLALGAAQSFGVDTIAFIGQDLSFETRSHSRGFADISDKIEEEKIEKGLIDVHTEMRGTFPTKNIFDEKVLTRSDFLSFKTAFEAVIKRNDCTFVNATEGGLPIEGATTMRLIDFIEQYCESSPQIDTFSVFEGFQQSDVTYNLPALIDLVENMKQKFTEIKQTSRKILKYIKLLKNLRKKGEDDSADLHNILSKTEALIEKVKHPVLDFLASTNYSFELYLHKQEIKEIDDIEDKLEKLDKQLERGHKYYNEVIQSIDSFKKELDRLHSALQKEEKIDSILENDSLDQRERLLKAGNVCKRAGLISQAVKYYEYAMEEHYDMAKHTGDKVSIEELHKIYISLAEVYMEQYRYDEASELLESLLSRYADSMKAKVTEKIARMLKTCNGKMKVWHDREVKMKKVMDEAESNYGSYLESGYFYFRAKEYEMAQKAYEKAINDGKGKSLVEAYYGLAHTCLSMDDPEKAFEAFEKAIEIDPDNPVLYRDLGFVAYANNNVTSAEIFFTKAIELAPQAVELYKPLADLYMGEGEKEKAVALYETALQANPDDPLIQKDIAMVLNDIITETQNHA